MLAGATLAVEAGTLVQALGPRARLVVEPGGRLEVRGERSAPVVFGCELPQGLRAPGCWGGLTAQAGASGTLRYLRVEFAGDAPGRAAIEFDGATSALSAQWVQAHASAGAGLGFRGGTAGCRYCAATSPGGAGLAWEAGWRGVAEGLHVEQGRADGDGLLGRGTLTGPPSHPLLSGVTLAGPGEADGQDAGGAGLRLLGGSRVTVRNLSVTGFGGGSIASDAASTEWFVAGESRIEGALLEGSGSPGRAPRVPPGLEPYIERRPVRPDAGAIAAPVRPDWLGGWARTDPGAGRGARGAHGPEPSR